MTALQTSWSHMYGGGGKIFSLKKENRETSCKTEHRLRRPLRKKFIFFLQIVKKKEDLVKPRGA